MLFLMQPDKLDDLSASIMQALTRLVHKVSPTDVVRAQNLVRYALYLTL
jgi:hypothetical protein